MRFLVSLLAVFLVLPGCAAHVPVARGDLQRISKLAIVTRFDGGPTVRVARVDGTAGGFAPAMEAEAADQMLADRIARAVGRFELTERLRSDLAARLPAAHPFSDALPAVQVSTALGTYLVEDRSGPADYGPLAREGVDAVLELVVSDFGLARAEGKTAMYLRGVGRMLSLPGQRTLWRLPLDLNSARDGDGEADPAFFLKGDAYREAVEALLARAAEKAAGELAAVGQP